MKIIFFLISGLVFGAFALAALGVILAVTGSPDTCSDREIPVSSIIAAELDERWEQFSADIAAAAGSIDITESEATSRARRYLEQQDIPVDDLRVYFCESGTGQLTGVVDALGLDAEFVVTARLDLSGPQPVVQIDSIHVGNMPGFISDRVFDLLLDDDARTLELDERLFNSQILDGRIIISGGPE